VNFSSVAFYSPIAYLPQAIAIGGGRWVGAGPLALLYLARLANALVAVALLAWSIRLMPIAPEALMVAALLPMAVYEYASASPDAAVISTAFLFTAVALRMQLRGAWTVGEVAIAAVSGLVFSSQKPVYAPLLVLGMPAVLTSRSVKDTLLAQAAILLVALGGTAFWIRFSWVRAVLPYVGISLTDQAIYIATHPLIYAETIARSFRDYGKFYYKSLIGVLGWMNLELPTVVYALPAVALPLGIFAQPTNTARLPHCAVAWNVLLLASSIFLVMTALYLSFNRVGSPIIEVVQGRYFLPLLPLFIATAGSVVRTRLSRKASLAASLLITGIVAVQLLMAIIAILRAYQVF
jgi:uncharacterized membrane protein